MAEQKTEKKLETLMIEAFRQWYQERFSFPIQYPSQNAYIVERNTMKGIANMLRGSWLYKHHNIGEPTDQDILEMWLYMLAYIKEKNSFCYNSLFSIHRNYNTIVAQITQHQRKQQAQQSKAKADSTQQKISFIQKMMGGGK